MLSDVVNRGLGRGICQAGAFALVSSWKKALLMLSETFDCYD